MDQDVAGLRCCALGLEQLAVDDRAIGGLEGDWAGRDERATGEFGRRTLPDKTALPAGGSDCSARRPVRVGGNIGDAIGKTCWRPFEAVALGQRRRRRTAIVIDPDLPVAVGGARIAERFVRPYK